MSAPPDHEDGPPNAPARQSKPGDDPELKRDEPALNSGRAEGLRARHNALRLYLRTAADEFDWHAVSDAANDLRCVEAELRGLGVKP